MVSKLSLEICLGSHRFHKVTYGRSQYCLKRNRYAYTSLCMVCVNFVQLLVGLTMNQKIFITISCPWLNTKYPLLSQYSSIKGGEGEVGYSRAMVLIQFWPIERGGALFEGALIWGEALIRGGFTVFHLFNPLTPVPVVTGRDKRRFFPFNVITFGQNWYQLYSNSVRGKDPPSDTQIRVIGSIGPEIRTRILWNLSEKLGVKFPSSTLGYSMETISRLDDGSWRPTTATKR